MKAKREGEREREREREREQIGEDLKVIKLFASNHSRYLI
jgi:hypothetical protein